MQQNNFNWSKFQQLLSDCCSNEYRFHVGYEHIVQFKPWESFWHVTDTCIPIKSHLVHVDVDQLSKQLRLFAVISNEFVSIFADELIMGHGERRDFEHWLKENVGIFFGLKISSVCANDSFDLKP